MSAPPKDAAASALDALPPLRDVVAEHDLGARKALGQHFLFDLNLTRKIARLAATIAPLSDSVVLEVGPGPGGLTRALLMEGSGRVVAVEKDARFAAALKLVSAAAPGRLTIVRDDALTVDDAALVKAHAPHATPLVVSNLPYNVGTALLVKWLTGAPWWRGLVLMFQKEVALRVVAQPGDAAYGRLAVLTALRAQADLALSVPARAFTPPPKVESAVVRFTPLAPDKAFADVALLADITAAAFGQRRKMLRRSMKAYAAQHSISLDAWLTAADIPGDVRPEEVPPAGFAALTRALSHLKNDAD